MLKSILCAVDGSEHADRAVTLASDLAERYAAKLLFLHVLPGHLALDQLEPFAAHAHLRDIVNDEIEAINAHVVAAIGPYADIYVPPASFEVITRIGEVILEDARQVAVARGVTEVETRMVGGDPAQRILEAAREAGTDMLVLGSRGLGHLAGLFMGSVSHKVAHQAECTCVTVK